MKFSDHLPFSQRHIGPDHEETDQMLHAVGARSIDEFIESVIPKTIRAQRSLTVFKRSQQRGLDCAFDFCA